MLNNLFMFLMEANATASGINVDFAPMDFVHSLKYMGIGMFSIIVVMGVLILITTVLNKLAIKFSKKDDNDKK